LRITRNTVARLEYTLTNDEGEMLDTSRGGAPLAYLHGTGSLIPGLERELEGRRKGETFQVRVPAADAYGERDDAKIHDVPRSHFPHDIEIEVGMQFQAESADGLHLLTVLEVDEEEVKVDANHPLAGVALTFDVEIVEVRVATPEELKHGHAHGEDGHDHESGEDDDEV